MPLASSELSSVAKNYMTDCAKLLGNGIDREISIVGEEAVMNIDVLDKDLADVSVNGMESSYAYLVSEDGMML